jgi:hypothetical protein
VANPWFRSAINDGIEQPATMMAKTDVLTRAADVSSQPSPRSSRSWIRNASLKLEQTSCANCMGVYYHMKNGI